MTAGMSQVRKRSVSYAMRRGLVCAVSAFGVWAASTIGAAPGAMAADIKSKQWYLDSMRAEEIWKSSTGAGIKIAVIDTGVNSSIPSLKGQVLKGLDATESQGEETDDYTGHGTSMAELIAGTGKGGGLRGLAPGVKIIPMRVATKDFKGKKADEWDEVVAIKAAADSDARIISMSLGTPFLTYREREAVKYAQSKGKLFFAPVGNSGDEGNKREFPASYEEVVGVAAIDREGQVAKYSQHGDFVDIAAPGNEIPYWCDATFTKYCVGNGGTSAATALTSASAALIWSAHPDWTANQVLRVMFESAGRGDDWKPGTVSNYLGHGIVRPNAAINRGIGKPGDPNLNPLTNEKTGGSAAPSAPASSQAPKEKQGSDAVVTGSSKSADDNSKLGLIIGGAAAAVVVAGVAYVVVRRQRAA
ncbi:MULTISPECIES: S8 family serine peptidase [unclassified Streptomyces]|uniref:S8 family serine peptidase n=1 Tax=unclassified Streptomyces TaxID=2593676 RepID=UPI00332BECF7